MIEKESNQIIDYKPTLKQIRHYLYYMKGKNPNEICLMSEELLKFFIKLSIEDKK